MNTPHLESNRMCINEISERYRDVEKYKSDGA